MDVPVSEAWNSILLAVMWIIVLTAAVNVDWFIMRSKVVQKELFNKKKVDWIWRFGGRMAILTTAWVAGMAIAMGLWMPLAHGIGIPKYPPVSCFGVDAAGEDWLRLAVISGVVWFLMSLYVIMYNGLASSASLMLGFSAKAT